MIRCRSCSSSGRSQLVAQVRLADQDDLNQLRLLGLEVREHPDFLERRQRQVLRLVDDQQRQPAGRRARSTRNSPSVVQQRRLRLVPAGSSPKSSIAASSSSRGSSSVFTTRATVVWPIEAAQQRLQQRRLAGADLAGDDDEAGVAFDAVAEVAERLLVHPARIEVVRDRASARRGAREGDKSVRTCALSVYSPDASGIASGPACSRTPRTTMVASRCSMTVVAGAGADRR